MHTVYNELELENKEKVLLKNLKDDPKAKYKIKSDTSNVKYI